MNALPLLGNAGIPPEWMARLNVIGIGTITLWAFCISAFGGLIGALIGSSRDRPAMGLFLGMVVPMPFGWIFCVFLDRGDGTEGIGSAIKALFMAAMLQLAWTTAGWNIFIRPAIDEAMRQADAQEVKVKAEVARGDAEEKERQVRETQGDLISWGNRSTDLTWQPIRESEVSDPRSFAANVVHHFTQGELLLHAPNGMDYVLVNHPAAFSVHNNEIIRFTAVEAGMTSFRTTAGTTQTAMRLVYVPHGERTANWMFDSRHRTALDR